MEDNINIIKVSSPVIHTEQKYVGVVQSFIDSEYCTVWPNEIYLQRMYPYGLKAKISKLVHYIEVREEDIIKTKPIVLNENCAKELQKELANEKPLFYTQEDVNRIYDKIQEAKIKLPELSKEELADMWGEKNKSDFPKDFWNDYTIMVLFTIIIGLLIYIKLS